MNSLDKPPVLPFLQSGKIIHFSQDDYGCILVIDKGLQRLLSFDSPFEQSCMLLCQPYQLVHRYTQLMALAVAFVDPDHITLLGLGGGSLLRSLHYALPNCSFHAIELRRAIVGVATEYFRLPNDRRVRISVNDAFNQITKTDSNSSDIIFSDMYDAYQMIPGQIQNSFLRDCARVLTDQGVLVLNLHHLPDDQLAFFEMLGDIFATVIMSTTTENIVLFASKASPEQLESNVSRVEVIEVQLHQRLAHLLSKLHPLQAQSTR